MPYELKAVRVSDCPLASNTDPVRVPVFTYKNETYCVSNAKTTEEAIHLLLMAYVEDEPLLTSWIYTEEEIISDQYPREMLVSGCGKTWQRLFVIAEIGGVYYTYKKHAKTLKEAQTQLAGSAYYHLESWENAIPTDTKIPLTKENVLKYANIDATIFELFEDTTNG